MRDGAEFRVAGALLNLGSTITREGSESWQRHLWMGFRSLIFTAWIFLCVRAFLRAVRNHDTSLPLDPQVRQNRRVNACGRLSIQQSEDVASYLLARSALDRFKVGVLLLSTFQPRVLSRAIDSCRVIGLVV